MPYLPGQNPNKRTQDMELLLAKRKKAGQAIITTVTQSDGTTKPVLPGYLIELVKGAQPPSPAVFAECNPVQIGIAPGLHGEVLYALPDQYNAAQHCWLFSMFVNAAAPVAVTMPIIYSSNDLQLYYDGLPISNYTFTFTPGEHLIQLYTICTVPQTIIQVPMWLPADTVAWVRAGR
jgi:hypothetical protein